MGAFDGILVKKAHPNVDMGEFNAKTVADRDLTRSELWVQRDIAIPDADVEVGQYLSIGDMKVPAGGGGAFLRLESEVFKPVHEARIAGGWMHNCGINQLFLPAETSQEYNSVQISLMPGSTEPIWWLPNSRSSTSSTTGTRMRADPVSATSSHSI